MRLWENQTIYVKIQNLKFENSLQHVPYYSTTQIWTVEMLDGYIFLIYFVSYYTWKHKKKNV